MRRLAVCAALLAFALTPAFAGITQDFEALKGTWKGKAVISPARTYPVELSITDSAYGQAAGDLSWGGLQDCSNNLFLWGEQEKTFTLKITVASDGHCRRLHDGAARVSLVSPTEIRLILLTPDGRKYGQEIALTKE